MNLPALALHEPQIVYARLMQKRRGDPVEDALARILSSWKVQQGSMPEWLGLGESNFISLMTHHFPDFQLEELAGLGDPLDLERAPEMEDLRKLLMSHRTSQSQSESWMVGILIAGCLGSDHLWQDLGLWERADLSKLMLDNFRELALLNNKDMKWKKFLYKQLCETEGIYTCRAPSCEVCVDYALCFGPEE